MKTFGCWELAIRRAEVLAAASGLRYRVASVPPSQQWPWTRWKVLPPLAELTPDARR